MGNAKDRAGVGRQGKEPEWEMRRTGRGVNRVKNRSGKCEGPGRGGGTNGCLKRKVFFLNQKHQPNIVEITHLCIMHGVHTSIYILKMLVITWHSEISDCVLSAQAKLH